MKCAGPLTAIHLENNTDAWLCIPHAACYDRGDFQLDVGNYKAMNLTMEGA